MAAAKKAATTGALNTAYLESQAEVVRQSLGPKADDLFKVAAEAGYLTALADGGEDAAEREALVTAIETLSKGSVIEWESETFIDEAYGKVQTEGVEARCNAVGGQLKQLGNAEAGLLIGAIVAYASNGIEKSEAQTLEKIGKAAGIERKQIAEIVKKARG
jgi:tellurite resistance protein